MAIIPDLVVDHDGFVAHPVKSLVCRPKESSRAAARVAGAHQSPPFAAAEGVVGRATTDMTPTAQLCGINTVASGITRLQQSRFPPNRCRPINPILIDPYRRVCEQMAGAFGPAQDGQAADPSKFRGFHRPSPAGWTKPSCLGHGWKGRGDIYTKTSLAGLAIG